MKKPFFAITYAFTWCFVLGVAAGTFLQAGIECMLPAYIAGGILLPIAVVLLALKLKLRRGIPNQVCLGTLMLAACALGLARYSQVSYIPPFDENAPNGNHIKSILETFPDVDRKDMTRIIGKVVSEPEYRPVPGKPGIVAITIQPYEVEPKPGSGKTYKVSDGNVILMLRPSQQFRTFESDWEKAFTEMAVPDAYGYIVEVEAQFQPFRPAENPGLFSAEDFYNDQRVFATASVSFWNKNAPALVIREKAEGNPLVEIALKLKKRMLGVIKLTVPFPESAFLAGVTLGARRGLDNVRCIFESAVADITGDAEGGEENDEPIFGDDSAPDLRRTILDEFRWSGTSHVLAVSGLHVTIITGGLWGLFVALRVPRKVYAPLVVLGLVIFCLITGAAPSTTRAVIMNSLVVLTYVYLGAGFKASLMLAIGFAGCAILVGNPNWLVQPAFALSFMAVISLGLLTGPCDRVLAYVPGYKRLPGWIQQFIAAQGAIQFGMMGPLSAYYFCRMSIAGPLANFIAIPLIGIIVQLGIFACALGLIPALGVYLALCLNAANYIMIWFFLLAAHLSTFLPFPYVQTLTPRMLAVYYALLGLFVYSKPISRYYYILYYDLLMGIGGARRRAQTVAIFLASILAVGGLAAWGFWPPQPDGKLHVNILAVRYGEAIHIQTPNGAQILVDAGPNDYAGGWNTGEKVVSQYLLKKRIGRLDALVMTDCSPEDMGGVSAILKIFAVERFFSAVPVWKWSADAVPDEIRRLAEGGGAESPRNQDLTDAIFHFTDLHAALTSSWSPGRFVAGALTSPSSIFSVHGPPVCEEVKIGTVIWQEEGPGGKFEITVLHPDPDLPLVPANNNAVVLRVRYGETAFLLTSSLTENGIRELLKLSPEMLRADVLLLPGHGSPKADVDLLYSTVFSGSGPKYAFASTGWSRDLKTPPGRGRRKENAPPPVRDSFLGHRQMYANDLDAALNALQRKLVAAGCTVGSTRDNGALLCSSDGTTVTVEPMLGSLLSPRAVEREERLEAE